MWLLAKNNTVRSLKVYVFFSGGIERAWVGVPRKLYEPGAATFRCACINLLGQSQVIVPETGKPRSRNLEEYEDCHPKSTSCFVHE